MCHGHVVGHVELAERVINRVSTLSKRGGFLLNAVNSSLYLMSTGHLQVCIRLEYAEKGQRILMLGCFLHVNILLETGVLEYVYYGFSEGNICISQLKMLLLDYSIYRLIITHDCTFLNPHVNKGKK